MGRTWRNLRRTALHRKTYNPAEAEQTNLKRCLSHWDLAALGVGSSLGVGVYVLVGHVALHVAGPSVVLSFLIAAVAALFAGLCFAECSARSPRAGAAYTYTHAALGEALAFLVGWCNILEFVVGSASLARGLSLLLDGMVSSSMSEWFTSVAPLSAPFVSPYFDFCACLIVLVMGAVLCGGVRGAALVNSACSALNVAVLLFIVAAGAFAADAGNWRLPAGEAGEAGAGAGGKGGFFPFGVWGTLRGAALCFYGFVGVDSVCAAAEEVRNPRRVIPLTIISVVLATLACYIGVAVVLTMMVPYYLQDPMSAVSEAFAFVGWQWARWIVSVGSLFGLYASLFGAMFPLPRLLYSMSSDGLLTRCFTQLCRQTPMIATILPTLLIAVLAGLFEVDVLVTTMCIGTLFSYTAVAASVIVMRYRSDYTPGQPKYLRQVFGMGRSPTLASARIVYVSLIVFMCLCVCMALLLVTLARPLTASCALHAAALAPLLVMTLQPQATDRDTLLFKTPLVPLLPCLSIYFNIHLMVIISAQTWLRAGVWILVGILVYLLRFCCHPKENKLKENMTIVHSGENGKVPVQIIVESPTPPGTIARCIHGDDTHDEIHEDIHDNIIRKMVPVKEDIVLQQAYVENNEEKEAKIIDLLDQVLQAEEDTYGDVTGTKESKDDTVSSSQETVHRKSSSELSDAGSDASLGSPALSKYDVIALVHREDLPRLNEEEEKSEREDNIENEDERVTAFTDSDSRTDESGYSDTIDRNAGESLEESKEDIPYIPVPPPMDEKYFRDAFKKAHTIASKHSKPPQLTSEDDDVNEPRESIKSNSTLGEDNITFGSDRQVHFMSKLNDLFQNKMTNSDDDEPRRRSHSTGNLENTEFSANRERSPMFMALKNEITSKEVAQNLRPVNAEERVEDNEEEKEDSMSRQDLKSKLENIFAAGGPKLLKPRLMKSNPPTPEESYQTDTSSTESVAKLPKMEKNDTLKRQKDKFSAVLNSFRQSIKDDDTF